SIIETIFAKFLAAWAFLSIGIGLTFPIVITVFFLGSPDISSIFFGYLGSVLLAGALLVVGMFFSAMTRNQIISFIPAALVSYLFMMAGSPPVMEFLSSFLPNFIVTMVEHLSFLNHFESLERGVLRLPDLMFFFLFMLAGMLATFLVIKEKTAMHKDNEKNRPYLTFGLIAIIVATLVTSFSIAGKRLRIDFTDGNFYTLSNGTKSILKKMTTPVTLRLFYSKTAANKGSEGIREFNNYYAYVKELIEEYVSYSKNNIKLEIVDPRPDTEDEENAVSNGLKRFQLTDTESYIFGLIAKSESGAVKTIEFFDPNRQEMLEYELSKLIASFTQTQKKRVGIISSVDVLGTDGGSPYMKQLMRMQGQESEEWYAFEMLREMYELKAIPLDSSKIEGIDILVIFHPKNLSEKLQFAIDQFVVNGGRTLLLIDPMATYDRTANMGMMGMGGGEAPASNLPKLLSKWGLEMKEDTFAGDLELAGFGQFSQFEPRAQLLPIVNCDKRCFDKNKDIVTGGIENLMFIFPGVLKLTATTATAATAKAATTSTTEEKRLQHTPILMTTDKGNEYSASHTEMNDPRALLQKFQEGKKPVVIAYKVHGMFETAFPNGIEIEEKDSGASEPSGSNSKKTKIPAEILKGSVAGAVVIVADTDFLSNRYACRETFLGITPINQNAVFFLNLVENLSGSTDLLSVKTKGKYRRPFTTIDRIEVAAEKDSAAKINEINASIQHFQQELVALAGSGKNVQMLQNEGVKKQKELNMKIADLKSKLREVKRVGREKVESIGKILQMVNILFIPSLIFILGIIVMLRRYRPKSCCCHQETN
ncbi:MAG: Gldg family protein, partial [Oligoflexia bacterium]|nr:Gldg family protein [Oligoflexia bacterium]